MATPKFCDHNYVDTVLWDGLSYRVTRSEWIATYDEHHRNVGDFVHKDDQDFANGMTFITNKSSFKLILS